MTIRCLKCGRDLMDVPSTWDGTGYVCFNDNCQPARVSVGLEGLLEALTVEMIEGWRDSPTPTTLGVVSSLIEALVNSCVPAPDPADRAWDLATGVVEHAPVPDDLGLSIDMLDVDRLRNWAEKLLIHGPDISHWASVPFVVSKLQTIATGMEKAIRDIGKLRAPVAETIQALKNSGIDTECGACMEVAFTGVTTNAHTCEPVAETPPAAKVACSVFDAHKCQDGKVYPFSRQGCGVCGNGSEDPAEPGRARETAPAETTRMPVHVLPFGRDRCMRCDARFYSEGGWRGVKCVAAPPAQEPTP